MKASGMRMLFVLLIFAVVFLFRDIQVLAMGDRKTFWTRLGVYTALQLAAITLMSALGEARPAISYAWTDRAFALIAILIQLAELAIAVALRYVARGRYGWIGCILPSPVFVVAVFGLSFAIQGTLIRLDPGAALQITTAAWLLVVGVFAFLLSRMSNEWEDRKFVGDFALMTSCTALMFVPFGLF
jgi:hypothetical protein